MGSVMESVKADKYTFRETDRGLEILRGNEPWISASEFPTIPGCNAVLALFHKVLELQKQLSSVPENAAAVLTVINAEAPALLRVSVPATDILLDHPNIVCGAGHDGSYSVRLLGVINGVLDASGLPKLNAVVEEDLETFLEFKVRGESKHG